MATVVENSLDWGRSKAFGNYTTTAGDIVCWPINYATRLVGQRFDDIDATAGDATSRFAAGFPLAGALWDPADKDATTDMARVVWDPGTGIVEFVHDTNDAIDGILYMFEGQQIWHSGYARAGTPPSGTASAAPVRIERSWQSEGILFTGSDLAAEATIDQVAHRVGRHQVIEFSDVNANAGDTYQAEPGLVGAVWDPKDKSDDADLCLLSWNRSTGVVTFTSGADDSVAGYLHLFYGGALVNF
jgi:hypothetical protein